MPKQKPLDLPSSRLETTEKESIADNRLTQIQTELERGKDMILPIDAEKILTVL